MTLFFGCRTQDMDLYREEKESMLREGVLDQVHLALSRKQGLQKVNSSPSKKTNKYYFCIIT
jgi:sulfite reductase alpha subunit-like flavoprotein